MPAFLVAFSVASGWATSNREQCVLCQASLHPRDAVLGAVSSDFTIFKGVGYSERKENCMSDSILVATKQACEGLCSVYKGYHRAAIVRVPAALDVLLETGPLYMRLRSGSEGPGTELNW